jgi:WD40 repeat protein
MASGKSRKWRPEAHEAGVNALLPLAPNQVASGDDDGCVKLWDPRQAAPAAELRKHTDYVSDFAHQACVAPSMSAPC